MRVIFWTILHVLLVHSLSVPIHPTNEWFDQAQQTLKENLERQPNYNVAKNVILFIGDGMGVSTVTASRIYRGQQQGQLGEEHVLSFEKFPNVGLSKTYNVDRQVPDSSGTATAMLSGIKTRFGIIGGNEHVAQYDCDAILGNEVDTILDWSHAKGKSTGLVTTTRLTHATPACAYGHSPWRFWEVDSAIPGHCRGKVDDLALQLLEHNRQLKVMLGGGRSYFMPVSEVDPEYPTKHGKRTDDRNLINEWETFHKENKSKARYVWNATQFHKVDPEKTDYLLGIFEPSHMNFELDRPDDGAGEPSIADMTSKAIQVLDNNDEGFFLLVEAGRIDHAHHFGNAKRAMEDTVALDEAVMRALELTDERDTLIIVTADHSHTLTIGSYAPRGNDILGVTDALALKFAEVGDEYPVTTLMYANGPGLRNRSELADADTLADDFKQPSLVPMKYETHAGEDVAIYAQGPMSHLISGVREQHYINHVMAYASCVGDNTGHCRYVRHAAVGTNAAKLFQQSFPLLFFILAMVLIV